MALVRNTRNVTNWKTNPNLHNWITRYLKTDGMTQKSLKWIWDISSLRYLIWLTVCTDLSRRKRFKFISSFICWTMYRVAKYQIFWRIFISASGADKFSTCNLQFFTLTSVLMKLWSVTIRFKDAIQTMVLNLNVMCNAVQSCTMILWYSRTCILWCLMRPLYFMYFIY